MVYIRRMYKRLILAPDRLPVVHNDHRNTGGTAVFRSTALYYHRGHTFWAAAVQAGETGPDALRKPDCLRFGMKTDRGNVAQCSYFMIMEDRMPRF